MTEIQFQQVAKSFGETEVVRPLDLVIKEGEFFTFVGPSGCGKSTVLNLIAGLEQPTAGDLRFDGMRMNDFSPRDRDVAMVFQNYALYPHMTVFENIAFPLKMKRKPVRLIRSEVQRTAALLDIEELLERKPRELSGGQRQRVALGRAIVRKPRVFLMDEPLSNLDARLRIEMRAELKLLHQKLGITTVYVTHDQGEALGLSDRVAVLERGEIQQCDRPEEVYRRPGTVFVAGFIGSPPMNFLRCFLRQQMPLQVECSGLVLEAGDRQPISNRVVAGIRPEDIMISATRNDGSIEVMVSVIEPAGSFNWAEVVWKGVKLRGVAAAEEQLAPGKTAYLAFARDKVSFFDEVSERRLVSR
jgi:multiple sugar transport system ATP-binding protein